ncbi:MAG: hypothetical protein ACQERD_06955 [Campylobacterota bacterium]
MKKAVVLLITLAIISVLSVIILNNLTTVDNILTKKAYSTNKTTATFIAKKINEEITKLVSNNQENIKEILEDDGIGSIGFTYDKNSFFINYLSYHEKIYRLKDLEKENFQLKRFLQNSDLNITNVVNYKQQDYIIATYLARYNDNRISEIENDITYLNDLKITQPNYYECMYTFSHQGIEYKVKILFKENEQKVEEFEIWN